MNLRASLYWQSAQNTSRLLPFTPSTTIHVWLLAPYPKYENIGIDSIFPGNGNLTGSFGEAATSHRQSGEKKAINGLQDEVFIMPM
jgi:hypothetical protein